MDARVRSSAAIDASTAGGIKSLLSYQLHQIVLLMSRGAALRYRREFGVNLGEWRTIALLGSESPLSLNQLARSAGLDKGQMSRVVSALTVRGIVLRADDDADGRSIKLSLTRAGEKLYAGLIRAACERDTAFLAGLTQPERVHLESALEKLDEQARHYIYREQVDADRVPARRARKIAISASRTV